MTFDSERLHKEWEAHLDAWLRGEVALKPPAEFIAENFAAQFVEQALAEAGILYA